jgi:hypothetical protein
MLTPFQGCGFKIGKIAFFYAIIPKNLERVIAFRIGQRPIKIGKLFHKFPNEYKKSGNPPHLSSSAFAFVFSFPSPFVESAN